MAHTHTCQQCGEDYQGDGSPYQVGEASWECDCPSQTACADCAPELYRITDEDADAADRLQREGRY